MPGKGITRRGAAGGAAAAVLTAAATSARRAFAQAGRRDVLIVGGGLAGLTAARRLRAEGVSVLVLEARERPGGRVHSEALASGTRIDVGAQYISDWQPHVTALAREAGAVTHPVELPGDYLFVSAEGAVERVGADSDPLSFTAQLRALWSWYRLSGAIDATAPADAAALDAVDAESFLGARVWGNDLDRFFGASFADSLCMELDRISAYELISQSQSMGGLEGAEHAEQWFIDGGAGRLAAHLAASLDDALLTGARVSRIVQDAGGVTVETGRGTFRASRAIVAVPPQLYGDIGLAPALPPARREVAGAFLRGRVFKTVAEFERPWWREEGVSGAIVNPGGMFHGIGDGTPGDTGTGVLVAFTSGPPADALGACASTEAARIAAFTQWLSDVYGRPVPPPIGGRSYDWNGDPFSLGGYASRRAPGGWTQAPDLFAPLGRLHFAGTETADAWRSYMDGAIQSGERAAREVLAA